MGSCMSSLSPEKTDVVSTRWRKASERSRKARRARGRRVVGGRLFSRFRRAADPSSQPHSGCGGLNEEELHRLPGRFFLNGATDKACLFTQQGRKGTNQDAMLVWENYSSRDDTIFCGVFDGHGPYGHMVAKKVRDALPLKLCNQWKAFTNSSNSHHQNDILRGSSNSEEATSIGVDDESFEPIDVNEGESLPELYSVLRKSLLSTFKLMDKELKLHETVDCFCSGSTAVTIIKQGQDLVIGNVGDSRAVLATRAKDNSLFAVQLTVDLKPNLPKEAARIQQCKGRVFALRDEPEVARVWLPNNDSPGLAMARAFGDFCLKDYGLISVPDISYHRITDRDEFVILATDGIWDVLSNKEVVDVIASAPTRATAARALVDCAVHAWRLKFPTSKTDDCAVVCLYLNPLSSSDQEPQISFGKISRELHERDCLTLPCKGNTDGVQLYSSVSGECQPVILDLEYPDTPGTVDAIEPLVEIKDDKLHERCHSTRRLADCMSTAGEEEWSALEGVTRVNSLLNLPRFSGDKMSTN